MLLICRRVHGAARLAQTLATAFRNVAARFCQDPRQRCTRASTCAPDAEPFLLPLNYRALEDGTPRGWSGKCQHILHSTLPSRGSWLALGFYPGMEFTTAGEPD